VGYEGLGLVRVPTELLLLDQGAGSGFSAIVEIIGLYDEMRLLQIECGPVLGQRFRASLSTKKTIDLEQRLFAPTMRGD